MRALIIEHHEHTCNDYETEVFTDKFFSVEIFVDGSMIWARSLLMTVNMTKSFPTIFIKVMEYGSD